MKLSGFGSAHNRTDDQRGMQGDTTDEAYEMIERVTLLAPSFVVLGNERRSRGPSSGAGE